jgi:hypothetical protein
VVAVQNGNPYYKNSEKVTWMPRGIKGSAAKREVVVDLRNVKELQRLLKAETESEAVRIAIEESVANLRISRSLNRFLDFLAREQASSRQ